jgi:hypothetical protein
LVQQTEQNNNNQEKLFLCGCLDEVTENSREIGKKGKKRI